MIPPRSELVGDTAFPGMVTESGDLVVLAVQRQGEELAGDTVLAVGDVLLLQGTLGRARGAARRPAGAGRRRSPSSSAARSPLGQGARRTLVILAAMVVLLATGAVPPAVAGLAGGRRDRASAAC